ncbi:MAG: hypothetical protein HQM03_00170 [Magnetococcales bacterium]|nr:hypothetical protein [Magnetococcales bacterium]
MRESGMETGELPFHRRLTGRFDGMIRQKDVSTLGDEMARRDGWYVVEPNVPMPETPVSGAAARRDLDGLVAEILEVERGVWTTMVYAQSFEDPWIIKVFHPRRAGCGCGPGGGVLPWKVFTRFKPGPVPEWENVQCATGQGDATRRSWLGGWH